MNRCIQMSNNRSFICFTCFQSDCSCPLEECQKNNISNTLTTINQQQKYNSSKNEKIYLNLFQPQISEGTDYFPSVAILCLHFEFMITDPFIICKLAKAVQKYIAVALGDLRDTVSTEIQHHDSSSTRMAVYEALSSFYLDVPPEFSSEMQSAYTLLKEDMRIICGDELFYNELLKLLNSRYSVATGLVPAYSRFMNIRCPGPKQNPKKRGWGFDGSKCQVDPVPCGALVYFHSFCYKCARVFDVKPMRICNSISSTNSSGGSSSSNSMVGMDSKNFETKFVDPSVQTFAKTKIGKQAADSSQKTAIRAIGVLCQLAAKTHHNVVERGTTIAFGGDLLFLLRNLAVSIHDRTAQKKCQRYLSRWMNAWLESVDEVCEENFMDVIKGLQVICKLKNSYYSAGATSLTDPKVKDSDRNNSNINGLTVLFSHRLPSASVHAKKGSSEDCDDDDRLEEEDGNDSDDGEGRMQCTTESIASDGISLTKLTAVRSGRKGSVADTASLASQMVGSSVDEILRKVNWEYDKIFRNVSAHLATCTYSEFIDCNFLELPYLTPPVTGSFCCSCGDSNGMARRKSRVSYSSLSFFPVGARSKTDRDGLQPPPQPPQQQQRQRQQSEFKKGGPYPNQPLSAASTDSKPNDNIKKCHSCGFHIKPDTINYAAACDSLVWLYICKDISLALPNGHCVDTQLRKLFRIMPIIRSYKTLEELGENMFKSQSYFITHLIYVFSDWGEHSVNRQLFAEEFIFIAENMKTVIALDDAELVGEFLHCLRVMQYSPYRDSDMEEVFQSGQQYLMSKEKALGSEGLFLDRSIRDYHNGLYDDYHTSYCAAAGLLEPAYTEEVVNLKSPVPNFLRIFTTFC